MEQFDPAFEVNQVACQAEPVRLADVGWIFPTPANEFTGLQFFQVTVQRFPKQRRGNLHRTDIGVDNSLMQSI